MVRYDRRDLHGLESGVYSLI